MKAETQPEPELSTKKPLSVRNSARRRPDLPYLETDEWMKLSKLTSLFLEGVK
jgi:hypothetical protein